MLLGEVRVLIPAWQSLYYCTPFNHDAGRQVGLFTSYEDVTRQTYGFPGAQHKSFLTIQEAEDYLREGGLHVTEDGRVMQLQPMALREKQGAGGEGPDETLSSM